MNGISPKPIPLRQLQQLAEPMGFGMLGVASAQPAARADFLQNWLAAGTHGEMHYLANYFDQRTDPRIWVPGARSVICVADFYHMGKMPAEGPHEGKIARYAWGDDYHKVLKKRLIALADLLREYWPDETYRVAVDTAPVMEREHAMRAGLGWTGKHTLLINPQLGSYMLLGEIVTTMQIETSAEADNPVPLITPQDHCGSCTRCIDACPTHCITPYHLDAKRCISYLTLEHRSAIDPSMHAPMGNWIAGCDICQEVCPYNQKDRTVATHPRYTPRPPAPAIALRDILNWSADDRTQAFTGSALKRIKLDMLKRNALIAAGNYLRECDDESLKTRIQELANDAGEPPLVRQTAADVLVSLSPSSANAPTARPTPEH